MKKAISAFIILFSVFFCSIANAATVIRDTEIETIIRKLCDPIFKAAGMDPSDIRIFILNDPSINAFVSGGNNIYIHTGLLNVSDDPEMLVGVMAHETGHIAGGHLLKSSDEYKNTLVKTTLGYALGLAAAAASGSPQAGAAILAGTNHVAQRQMLKYSRTNEESADQHALNYLEKSGQSASGLKKLMEILYNKESTIYGDVNPYILTHPLSRERLANIENHIKNSKFSNKHTPDNVAAEYKMSIAKLKAFLDPYEPTLKKYEGLNTETAHYARSIAYYKKPDIEKSLSEISLLIEEQPTNPYFNEFKGQILFENGRILESIPYYEKSKKLLPQKPLLKIQLATAQIASGKESLIEDAILNLKQALLEEQDNVFAWRQLATAYGRTNQLGLSNLALAEEALIMDNKDDAKKFIELAKPHIKQDTPAYYRMGDIQAVIKEKK